MLATSAALLSVALPLVRAASYTLNDNIVGPAFNSEFNWMQESDPTHGFVEYVNQATAQSLNLTYTNANTFILRSDFTTTLSASGAGRKSVRIESKKQWSTSVLVADIRHMPQGCGTWPAFWTYGSNWPANGEIDILEGVNDQGTNAATLHTSPGCTQPSSRTETGSVVATDCNTAVNGNAGCGVKSNDATSYGPAFNNNGGGWYAMERTTTYIKVWFWPRNSASVPAGVKSGSSSIDTANWGTPFASFVNNSCDIGSHFGPNNIVINLTFCGDWAGQQALYAGAGCPSTCNAYVAGTPSAFKNAYFDFAALRVYT